MNLPLPGTPPGCQAVLIVYADPKGNIGVSGPINDPVIVLDCLGKAAQAVAHHLAQKMQETPAILIAKEQPVIPKELNGQHPPLRRI